MIAGSSHQTFRRSELANAPSRSPSVRRRFALPVDIRNRAIFPFSSVAAHLFRATKDICAIVFIFFCSSAQAQSLDEHITQYFLSVRQGGSGTPPGVLYDSVLAGETLNKLEPYTRDDTITSVRLRACEISTFLSAGSGIPTLREKGVDILFSANGKGDTETTGVILEMLKTFLSDDYGEAAKDQVRIAIKSEGPYLAEWMRMAAFLNLVDVIQDIRPYSQPGNRRDIRWSALVSLARLGDASAASELMTRVQKLPVNDDFVYGIIPDLMFTRQPEPIQYAVKILSDNARLCLSPNPENETPIPCGYRVMEQLAPVIEGFPLKVDASGDLITEDYVNALDIARKWLKENHPYKIRRDTY